MINKILSQGISKAMRKMIFTDATVFVKDEVLLRAFIDELNDRSTIKTKQSRLRCSVQPSSRRTGASTSSSSTTIRTRTGRTRAVTCSSRRT